MATVIKLTGRLASRVPAKTHQANLVKHFSNSTETVTVTPTGESAVYKLTTQKNNYLLKYLGNNTWGNTCAGHKVKFTRKKIVAKLIWY